jgi:hypothetical protein
MSDGSTPTGLGEDILPFDSLGTRSVGASDPQLEAAQPSADSNTIKKGGTDPLGDTVKQVHICTDRFIIYSIDSSEGQIRRPRYFLRGTYATAEEYRQRLNGISGALNRINDLIVGMRPDNMTLPFYRKHYESLVERSREHQAQAMQQAFEGHGADALQILAEFREEIVNCRDSRNKMRYILANAVSMLVLLAFWYGLRNGGDPPGTIGALMSSPTATGAEHAAVRLADMLALGAIGAFFSVSIGINNLKIDNAITIPEMFYAGFVRILIGVIGAGVVFLLIFGGWMLTAVSPPYQLWSYSLFAFLAGFSELLVPNALKGAEETVVVKAPAAAAAARPPAAAGKRLDAPNKPS